MDATALLGALEAGRAAPSITATTSTLKLRILTSLRREFAKVGDRAGPEAREKLRDVHAGRQGQRAAVDRRHDLSVNFPALSGACRPRASR
jgi:hypothetical protein